MNLNTTKPQGDYQSLSSSLPVNTSKQKTSAANTAPTTGSLFSHLSAFANDLSRKLNAQFMHTFNHDAMAKTAVGELIGWGLPESIAQRLAQASALPQGPDAHLAGYLLCHAQLFHGGSPRLQAQLTPEHGLVISTNGAPLDASERARVDELWRAWQALVEKPQIHHLFNALAPLLSPATVAAYLNKNANSLRRAYQAEAFPAPNVFAAALKLLTGSAPAAKQKDRLPEKTQKALAALLETIDPVAFLRSQLHDCERARTALKKNAPETVSLPHMKRLKALWEQAVARNQPDLADEANALAMRWARQFPEHKELCAAQTSLALEHQQTSSQWQLDRMSDWFHLVIGEDPSGEVAVKLTLEPDCPKLQDPQARAEACTHVRDWLYTQLRGPKGLPWPRLQEVIGEVATALPDQTLLTDDHRVDMARLQAQRHQDPQSEDHRTLLRMALLKAAPGSLSNATLKGVLRVIALWSTQPELQAELLRNVADRLPPRTAETEALHQRYLDTWARLAHHDRATGRALWNDYLSQHPLPQEHAARLLVPLLLDLPLATEGDAKMQERVAILFNKLAQWLPRCTETRTPLVYRAWLSVQAMELSLEETRPVAGPWLQDIQDTIRLLQLITKCLSSQQVKTLLDGVIQTSTKLLEAWRVRTEDEDDAQAPLLLTALLGAARDVRKIPDDEQMDTRLRGYPEVQLFQQWSKLLRTPPSYAKHKQALESLKLDVRMVNMNNEDPFDDQTRVLVEHLALKL